jgi:hypothetical protein
VKYEDIDDVVNLKEIASRIKKQYDKLSSKESRYKEVDCGGVLGVVDTGFLCNISLHKDGSGEGIDLSGCYVGAEVFDAVQIILEEKFDACKNALSEFGVDVTEMKLFDEGVNK